MLEKFRVPLVWKFFLAFFLAIAIGAVVWLLAVELIAPTVFIRHMNGSPMMGMDSGMMRDGSLLDSFRAAMNEVFLWGAGAALIAALLASWLLSRQLVAPIQTMKEISGQFADGQFEQRVALPTDTPADELGELSLSFNRMAEQLQETEQMRLELIGDVSHELRTPLTSIKGSMEGLIDGVLDPTPETFQSIYREADRLQRLVTDLQELSRAEMGKHSFDIQPLLVDVLFQTIEQRLGQQFKEKGVSLEFHVEATDLQISADEDRTIQILINLVGNALQYTPEGGYVLVGAASEENLVRFSVQDTGIGIADEDQAKVFRRFYRAEKSRARASGGSGIGLTIAKRFVEGQGGKIWVKSDGLAKGSIFNFTLPKAN